MSRRPWSYQEIYASVEAYMELLTAQQSGRPLVKADVRRRWLQGPLSGRTKGSYEFRMQNISAVREALELPLVEGYRPAQNVGVRPRTLITKAMIERSE